MNLVPAAAILVIYSARLKRGLVTAGERGVVAGAAVLLAIFVVTLPFVGARVAIAIQLQISRVLWPIEFLATVYLIWAVAEGPWLPSRWTRMAPILLFAVLAAASTARGIYILAVEIIVRSSV